MCNVDEFRYCNAKNLCDISSISFSFKLKFMQHVGFWFYTSGPDMRNCQIHGPWHRDGGVTVVRAEQAE